MPTDNKVPLNTRVRPKSEIDVRPAAKPAGLDTGHPSKNSLLEDRLERPGYPATLDEELAMIVEQREQARGTPPYVPVEDDADEPTRKHFLRGTETVSQGYLGRLTEFSEPAPVEDPIGREYRRRDR